MPRIPLDHPAMQPDPPSPRGERSPLDVMVETAALEEQNIRRLQESGHETLGK